MNVLFLAIVLIACLTAGYKQLQWQASAPQAGADWANAAATAGASPMEQLSAGMIASAAGAVELAIGLVGIMALFLGLMKVAEEGGLLTVIAKLIRPLMVRLFPQVPPNHPAMGAMILNMSATALGLGNAATPFGIRAMQALDALNARPGTATNAMALFLAINTSGVTLLPAKVIAIRAAAGSMDPAGILPTTLFATIVSTVAAIVAALLFQRYFPVGQPTSQELAMERPWVKEFQVDDIRQNQAQDHSAYPLWVSMLALGCMVLAIPATIVWGKAIAPWIVPGMMLGFLLFGWLRGVRIYESFIAGAKDGFDVALRIMPYLVAILVAVGMLRSSGALDVMVGFLAIFTAPLGLPAEALPMALLRPLSGSGSYGVMSSILTDPAIGPDSYVGYLVSTIMGSSETTFYVLAVYFGAVQVRRIRHTLIAALIADVVAVMASVAICSYLFGQA
ncbi:nucleoside recognition domain-containing protein [Lampropedia aestuarii]|uniref:nucleoside recognition domain-containing protein n=1 Tax=Lampropedia aestuarii TaxID=2562762 RepID=UPI002469AAB9|nr:nucleoside recognition domain-containing protein [Lampropedia aestuarii]MDH5855976.1 nucleoside recognition domain-containing protein [Lampropedia aestuarii]